MGIENDLVFVGRSKMTCFVRGSTDMFFVWVVKFDLISVLGIELDVISSSDDIGLVVKWVVENDIISVWWLGIDLVFV